MEADFRPKIEFDPPLAQKGAKLQYQTPQLEPPVRWRPSKLFIRTAAVSATINVILGICFVLSGESSRLAFVFVVLLLLANLPAIPVMYLLRDVLDAMTRFQPGMNWAILLFFCCAGPAMWGLTVLLMRELLRFAVWFFGDCW